ncbi:MAG: aminoacetone oxidase family FAD-binding enzyme [Desulfovibrionaceae bacterium]|nr:aminoacetone oxidase family FAD-binding enzyme [Desulfovibrionaceae bacterium]
MPDIVILGAGASGLFFSRLAASRGLDCVILDHAACTGRKLRIAGGGRGNITNLTMGSAYYTGEHPDFSSMALRRCPPSWILDFLDERGIPWEERDHRRIFCRRPSGDLADCLEREFLELGGRIICGVKIGMIRKNAEFCIETDQEVFVAKRLVVATGGVSWPQIGSSDFGLRTAHAFGHRIVPLRPALVPLICPDDWILQGLAGISVNVRISTGAHSFEDSLLFTHKGLSGPAALCASCFHRSGDTLQIDFLPSMPLEDLMLQTEYSRLSVRNFLRRLLPDRLAERLIPPILSSSRIGRLSREERKIFLRSVHQHCVIPLRTEGMRKAEVSAGGVDVSEINPKSMESRLCPGLYFIGEVMDITGMLGGYNLHWAWASAKACAESIKKA